MINSSTELENLHVSPPDAKPMLPAVPSSEVYLEDCVKALKRFNDKHFDLAIVDPPYMDGDNKALNTLGTNRLKFNIDTFNVLSSYSLVYFASSSI